RDRYHQHPQPANDSEPSHHQCRYSVHRDPHHLQASDPVTRTRALLVAAGLFVAPRVLHGQAATTLARTGATFESYSFHTGLAFRKISEFTIPMVVTQRVGDRLVLDVGTAFVSASATLSNNQTVDHSGLVDTDIRAT